MLVLDDPWSELVQSGCTLEAGVNRPLLASILKRLKAVKEGKTLPPLKANWEPTALHHLCQTALLWAIAGEDTEASYLAHWLLQFVSDKPLLSLWCREEQFNDHEGRNSFSLLLRAVGDIDRAKSYFTSTDDPFLIALAQENVKIHPLEKEPRLDYGLKILQTAEMKALFTLTGDRTSLGVIQAGDVEIRALGPQSIPLSDARGFGISQKASGTFDWVRCHAQKDVWIEVKPKIVEEEIELSLRFVGVKLEAPISFAFYVKAKNCTVGLQEFKPKSLSRFKGEASQITFQEKLHLESSIPRKVQVVPLAGEGCFWDSEFLVAYEIQPHEQLTTFRVHL